jgi:predicted ATPase
MIFLQRAAVSENTTGREKYPFTVPALRALESIEFTPPVTFFLGENGSGKSTLLEALALKTKLPPPRPQANHWMVILPLRR